MSVFFDEFQKNPTKTTKNKKIKEKFTKPIDKVL